MLVTISGILGASGFVWCLTIAWLIHRRMGASFAPLMLPALLGAFGAWAAWRRRTIALFVAAGVFAVFSILTGFSIGAGYLPAAAAFFWSGLVNSESQD
jgi:hypothetical protein